MDRDYNNKKPYRSKELKEEAKKKAYKNKDGHWTCPMVPVLYHPIRKDLMRSLRKPT